jgi:hypothetical protein
MSAESSNRATGRQQRRRRPGASGKRGRGNYQGHDAATAAVPELVGSTTVSSTEGQSAGENDMALSAGIDGGESSKGTAGGGTVEMEGRGPGAARGAGQRRGRRGERGRRGAGRRDPAGKETIAPEVKPDIVEEMGGEESITPTESVMPDPTLWENGSRSGIETEQRMFRNREEEGDERFAAGVRPVESPVPTTRREEPRGNRRGRASKWERRERPQESVAASGDEPEETPFGL